MKPNARILPVKGRFSVHVVSRVVNRDFVLGNEEKEYFLKLMRALAGFSGIEIMTYAILDNHFHILAHVPELVELSDEQLIERIRMIHGRFEVAGVRQRLEHFKTFSSPFAYKSEREKYLGRMCNLGAFMKALKQQFTRWYNKRNQRTGTLWEARYKSVLVEGAGAPLQAVAAYIDLNAVRAGICDDPLEYRWCGYGEAVAGGKSARLGFTRIAELSGRSTDWRMVSRMYRKLLYTHGAASGRRQDGQAVKKGFSREDVVRVWEEDGALKLNELLQCRIRYFSDGVAIGGQDFVQSFFESCSGRFGDKRQRGGSPMKGEGFDGIFSMRNLQVDVVT